MAPLTGEQVGWPGANPTDDKFFKTVKPSRVSKLVAFGMMRKKGKSASNDPGLNSVLNSGVSAACLVGKAWDFQVKNALKVPLSENLDMISDSINYASSRLEEVMFDAEHFFDGFKDNSDYALSCLKRAYDSGAKWLILCDTNGGTLPFELKKILSEVKKIIPLENVGVHFHNDSDNATYNSIESERFRV